MLPYITHHLPTSMKDMLTGMGYEFTLRRPVHNYILLPEIWTKIFKNCEENELGRIACVSKKFNDLSSTNEVWNAVIASKRLTTDLEIPSSKLAVKEGLLLDLHQVIIENVVDTKNAQALCRFTHLIFGDNISKLRKDLKTDNMNAVVLVQITLRNNKKIHFDQSVQNKIKKLSIKTNISFGIGKNFFYFFNFKPTETLSANFARKHWLTMSIEIWGKIQAEEGNFIIKSDLIIDSPTNFGIILKTTSINQEIFFNSVTTNYML